MDLRMLRKAGEEAAKIALKNKHIFENSAVNWGDFHCVGASFSIDDDGHISYSVSFEECSYSATLAEYLRDMTLAEVEKASGKTDAAFLELYLDVNMEW